MAERIADVGENLVLFKVHVDEIREQDVNARVMPPEMLERLGETVKKERRLEQLPFACVRSDHFELISGHHRLRAARSAGMTEVFILGDTRDLSRSAIVAKQLAHNRISGHDDPQMLKQLYEEMDHVDDVLESYVRPDDFNDVKQLEPSSTSDLGLQIPWRQLSLVFLPGTMDKLDELERVAKRVPRNSDAVGVVSNDVFDRFRSVMLGIGKVEDVRSLGAIMTRLIEIGEEWIEEHGEREDDPAAGDAEADGAGKGAVRRTAAGAAGKRKRQGG